MHAAGCSRHPTPAAAAAVAARQCCAGASVSATASHCRPARRLSALLETQKNQHHIQQRQQQPQLECSRRQRQGARGLLHAGCNYLL